MMFTDRSERYVYANGDHQFDVVYEPKHLFEFIDTRDLTLTGSLLMEAANWMGMLLYTWPS